MATRRSSDHYSNNKFKVEIEGVTQATFMEVGGLESTTEVIHYADGSDNLSDRKRPGRTTYSNIILKRGYINTHDLWDWYKKVMEGKVSRKSGSIILCDDDGTEVCRYNFFEAWPCRWKSMLFNASEDASLIEELEIVVEKIERG
jgi:phage tail-like protein